MFGSSWSSATLCQVSSPTHCTVTSILSSVDHLLLCPLCRFTAAGVRSAAQLSQVTTEDCPILGISSAEDRTQLLRLVQMLKSLHLWCEAHDSEFNSTDTDKNQVGDGLTHCSCLGDVYDLSGVGKRLDVSGKTFSHHQRRSFCPAHVHVSARHDRNAQPGQGKEAAGPLHPQLVTRCLELNGKGNSWIDNQNTKIDPHRDSTSRPAHVSSPRLSSEALPSMQLSSRLVWQQERKGIAKNERLCTEKSRRKTLERKAATMPVYESRTAGYNYGLPLSSPPVPNNRWVWVGEQCSFPSPWMCLVQEKESIFQFSKDFWHGVGHKIIQITANMQDNSFVTHFIHQSFWMSSFCFFFFFNHRIKSRLFLFQLQCHCWFNGTAFSSFLWLLCVNCRQQRQKRISVCVRKRPLTHAECRRGEADVVTTLSEVCVTVNERKEAVDLSQYVLQVYMICMLVFKEKGIICLIRSNVSTKYHQCGRVLCNLSCVRLFLQHRFYFDDVFGEESTNEEVYRRTAYPLVQHMLHR